jgi:hypothetical protein
MVQYAPAALAANAITSVIAIVSGDIELYGGFFGGGAQTQHGLEIAFEPTHVYRFL